ncbi:MAG: hypothetical protein ACI8T1_003403 [Verrucomicrobiales bacterium]|jgi:hypothetical protein
MKKLLTGIAFAMLVLHQDFWLWENTNLMFGFMPTGLVYHACFSIAVAVLAVLAIIFAWPHDLIRWATGEDVKTNLEEKKYTIR